MPQEPNFKNFYTTDTSLGPLLEMTKSKPDRLLGLVISIRWHRTTDSFHKHYFEELVNYVNRSYQPISAIIRSPDTFSVIILIFDHGQ